MKSFNKLMVLDKERDRWYPVKSVKYNSFGTLDEVELDNGSTMCYIPFTFRLLGFKEVERNKEFRNQKIKVFEEINKMKLTIKESGRYGSITEKTENILLDEIGKIKEQLSKLEQ